MVKGMSRGARGVVPWIQCNYAANCTINATEEAVRMEMKIAISNVKQSHCRRAMHAAAAAVAGLGTCCAVTSDRYPWPGTQCPLPSASCRRHSALREATLVSTSNRCEPIESGSNRHTKISMTTMVRIRDAHRHTRHSSAQRVGQQQQQQQLCTRCWLLTARREEEGGKGCSFFAYATYWVKAWQRNAS